MFERLEQIASRYEELGAQLAEPETLNDQAKYQKVAKQHRDLASAMPSTMVR
jgi:peptide chain release factor 1